MNLINERWAKKDYTQYLNFLTNQPDLKYQKFNKTLITTKYKMIGIRIPLAKELAKEIKKGNYQSFLNLVGHTYYEEILIEGLIIASLDDKKLIEKYIPKIDNWGLCDYFCLNAKFVGKNPEYFNYFLEYLKSDEEYKIRTGLVMILCYFVKDVYIDRIYKAIEEIKIDKYYVNMAIAWLLCECYIKLPKETNKYLKVTKINDWTFNKTISKIKESYRVSKEEKNYLTTLKRRRQK